MKVELDWIVDVFMTLMDVCGLGFYVYTYGVYT